MIVLALAVCGCGGSGPQQPASGRQLFATDCSACHSLSVSDHPSRQGGDLRGLRISRAAMLQFVRQMPVRHRLTAADSDTVARYVLAVEQGARTG